MVLLWLSAAQRVGVFRPGVRTWLFLTIFLLEVELLLLAWRCWSMTSTAWQRRMRGAAMWAGCRSFLRRLSGYIGTSAAAVLYCTSDR